MEQQVWILFEARTDDECCDALTHALVGLPAAAAGELLLKIELAAGLAGLCREFDRIAFWWRGPEWLGAGFDPARFLEVALGLSWMQGLEALQRDGFAVLPGPGQRPALSEADLRRTDLERVVVRKDTIEFHANPKNADVRFRTAPLPREQLEAICRALSPG